MGGEWIAIAFIALAAIGGGALALENKGLMPKNKTGGWEKLDPEVMVTWKETLKTLLFLEKKDTPDGKSVLFKDALGKVWQFPRNQLDEPSKEASTGGDPSFIFLVYDENKKNPILNSQLKAYKMQVKKLENELESSTSTQSNAVYAAGKVQKALRKMSYGDSLHDPYGGRYGEQPYGGIGGNFNRPENVRSVEEGKGEES